MRPPASPSRSAVPEVTAALRVPAAPGFTKTAGDGTDRGDVGRGGAYSNGRIGGSATFNGDLAVGGGNGGNGGALGGSGRSGGARVSATGATAAGGNGCDSQFSAAFGKTVAVDGSVAFGTIYSFGCWGGPGGSSVSGFGGAGGGGGAAVSTATEAVPIGVDGGGGGDNKTSATGLAGQGGNAGAGVGNSGGTGAIATAIGGGSATNGATGNNT